MIRAFFPFKGGYLLTQRFGENLRNYTQFGLIGHNGLDWATPSNTDLFSVDDDGVVTSVTDVPGAGRWVEIAYKRFKAVYGHLATIDVKVGDKVSAKQKIGTSNGELSNSNPGYSTGAHLHFGIKPLTSEPEYNYGNGYKGAIDPLPMMLEWSKPMPTVTVLYTGTTTASAGLNVRNQPNIAGAKIGSLNIGTRVEVIGEFGDWLEINWVQKAYVSKTYVKRDVVVVDPPASSSVYVPGMDVSFYQGATNDFDTAHANGIRFAIIRAGQNLTKDSQFDNNWARAKGKVLRGAYWFYDWRSTGASPEAQGAAFKRILGDDPGELPPTMDFEDPYSTWTEEAFPSRTNAYDIMRRFKAAVGSNRGILYTNQATLSMLAPYPSDITAEWLLWVAQWPLIKPEGVARQCRDMSEIPAGLRPTTYGWTWTFWQYSAKTDGRRFGVGSLDLDGDVFNGTEADLNALCNVVVPNKKLTLEEKVAMLWVGRCEYCGTIYENQATCPKCGAPR